MKTSPAFLMVTFATTVLIAGCGERAANDQQPEGVGSPTTETPADQPGATAPTADASVQLSPTQGNTVTGDLRLAGTGTGVRIMGTVTGLTPNGEFGFHVHENGDCSAPDASSAGPHFNPTNSQHGNPAGDAHHAGDMYNIKSDAQGQAQIDAQLEGVTLAQGQPTDVDRRAIVVHEKPDDYTTQPSGNSGSRIACGVITAGAGQAVGAGAG